MGYRIVCPTVCLALSFLGACGDDSSPSTTGLTTATTGIGPLTSDDGNTTDPATAQTDESGVDEGSAGESTAAADGGSSTGATGSTGGSTGAGSTGEVSVCGNNVIEGNEVCDLAQLNGETCQSLGHEGGQLGCLLTCEDYNLLGCFICGNGTLDLAEECEGGVPEDVDCFTLGFEGGTVTCGDDCFYDTTACALCGDGITQDPESCDGLDLAGNDCASLGLTGGTLSCTPSCTYDFSECDIPGVPFGSDVGYNGFALSLPMTLCDDISATGTNAGLTDDDAATVPMGFTFPFYGVDYTDITLQSNGAIHFGSPAEMGLTNSCLPTASSPSTNMLYVFWDDLNPTVGAGAVRYELLGMPGDQRFVVQFDTANFSGDASDLMRFQVVLHEASGNIDVCYEDTINAGNSADNGAEATSGIQLDSATGFQFNCNTPDLVAGTQLLYIPI
ncbi:MAG: hypothetical protein AAF799_31125 [Myxococcota bacterium]